MRSAFLLEHDGKLFFGKWRLANGKQIWQISPHMLGIFHRCSLRQNVGEIEDQFFWQTLCDGNFLPGEQSLVKLSPCVILIHYMLFRVLVTIFLSL